MSKRLAGSDLAVIGLTRIGPIRIFPYWTGVCRIGQMTVANKSKLINNKRLLHDIFHIGPGISPRLPYQDRQRRWRADMGRELIPGTIWKISCHNLFITYFTFTFFKH
jgi:hypothetical protein